MDEDWWCELCYDKLKDTTVKVGGRIIEVCSHCKSLTVEDKGGEDTHAI